MIIDSDIEHRKVVSLLGMRSGSFAMGSPHKKLPPININPNQPSEMKIRKSSSEISSGMFAYGISGNSVLQSASPPTIGKKFQIPDIGDQLDDTLQLEDSVIEIPGDEEKVEEVRGSEAKKKSCLKQSFYVFKVIII